MNCPNCGNPSIEQLNDIEYYCNRCRQHFFVKKEDVKKNSKQDFSSLIDSILRIQTEHGTGTGFIVSKEGYVVTNAHVMKDEIFGYGIIGNSDDKVELEVLLDGSEEDLDLCLLQIVDPADNLTSIKFTSETPKLGETVYAVGNPKNIGLSVSKGSISRTAEELYQLDLTLNTGNSGGPVVNEDGELLGVVSFSIEDLQGMSFAIPSRIVKEFIKKEVVEE